MYYQISIDKASIKKIYQENLVKMYFDFKFGSDYGLLPITRQVIFFIPMLIYRE